MFSVTETLRAELLKPAFNLRLSFAAGSTSLDQSRILSYELKEHGRYGEATLTIDIDNADGTLTGLTQLQPFTPATFSEGAYIFGAPVTISRHTWRIVEVREDSRPGPAPHFIRITCTNAYSLLLNPPAANTAYDDATFETIISAIATAAGLTASFDSSTLWAALADFIIDTNASLRSNLLRLIDDNLCAHARFGGVNGLTWSLTHPTINPAAVATIGTTGNPQLIDTAHRFTRDAVTRIKIVGAASQLAGAITDLENNGRQRQIVISTPLIRDADITARYTCQVIEQREDVQELRLTVQPDLRLQIHDPIALHNIPGITNGSVWRITEVSTKLTKNRTRGTTYPTHITARPAATTSASTTTGVISPSSTNTSIEDNFDTYGNDVMAQSGSAGLYWLRLLTCDNGASGEALSGGATYDNTQHIEGTHCALLPTGGKITRTFTATDFTQEGRFDDDDRFVIWYYATGSGGNVRIRFHGGAGALDVSRDFTPISGPNRLGAAKSDFIGSNNNWSAVDTISVEHLTGAPDVYVDDICISKRAIANPLAPAPLGKLWSNNVGEWSIYQDVAGVDFALGQILNGGYADGYHAIRIGDYSVEDHFACGLLARDEPGSLYSVGLIAFAADLNNHYRLKLNTANDRLKLFVVINGIASEIATVTLTGIATNTAYYLGLSRESGYLRAYLSTSNSTIFTADNLKLYVQDATYTRGKVGVLSDGVNARFFNVRAGLTVQPY